MADGDGGVTGVGLGGTGLVFRPGSRGQSGDEGGREERGRPPGRVIGVVKRKRARPERYGAHKAGLHPGLLGVSPVVTASSLTALVDVQRLLQLLLQDLISSLQFVHFGQKAPEPQVESFEDADVGAQVVSESHGCGRV